MISILGLLRAERYYYWTYVFYQVITLGNLVVEAGFLSAFCCKARRPTWKVVSPADTFWRGLWSLWLYASVRIL